MSGRAGQPRIGLAIPAWRAAELLPETLDAALAQRGVDLTVSIGVDGDDAETAAAAETRARDPRVHFVTRPERLGWVANSSATLAEVVATGVDFAAILPHDDIIEPDYLATLHATMAEHPEAACVYCDIVSFGERVVTIRQKSVTGAPVDRQVALLRRQYSAVAWRGLTRASALEAALPMIDNSADGFAADVVWMAQVARFGDLIRVPQPLYRKRLGPGSVHARWRTWTERQQVDAWLVHCRDMFDEATAVCETEDDWRRVRGATARRMRRIDMWLGEVTPLHHRRTRRAAKALRATQPPPAFRNG